MRRSRSGGFSESGSENTEPGLEYFMSEISPKFEENNSFPPEIYAFHAIIISAICDDPTLGCSARIRGCVLWGRWPTVVAAMSFRQVQMLNN
jgi:hypothetical protein